MKGSADKEPSSISQQCQVSYSWRDCSEFADISEGTEFRAGFHNAFDRRFVRRVAGVRYGPQRRFRVREVTVGRKRTSKRRSCSYCACC